jgi:sporulation protein YlmC with PRC-barrel domain
MTSVRLSELLGRPVVDEAGRQVGVVHDLQATQAGPVGGGFDAAVVVTAIVVGTRGVRDRLGLSPQHVKGPLLARLLFRAARPTDAIPWSDVVAIEDAGLVVRSGATGGVDRPSAG